MPRQASQGLCPGQRAVHALLAIESKEAMLSHPVVGSSWEGFVVDNLLSCTPATVQVYFYRTSGGAEVDLLLTWPGGEATGWRTSRSTSYRWCKDFWRSMPISNGQILSYKRPGDDKSSTGQDPLDKRQTATCFCAPSPCAANSKTRCHRRQPVPASSSCINTSKGRCSIPPAMGNLVLALLTTIRRVACTSSQAT